MNKYINKTLAGLALVALATGCSDFGDTNVDPEHLNQGNVPYQLVFSNAQHQALGSDWDAWRNGMIYLSQWNQHCAAGGWWWSYGINAFSDGYSSAYWDSVLSSGNRGALRDITTVMQQWKDDPTRTIDYQMARVVRVYIASRLTDLYGDMPYSEAGQPEQFKYPKYDTQEDIYKDMLKELDEAQAALGSGSATMGKADLYFDGDAAKWKKFANSLMLRLAMRLTKVDANTAKTYAAKAYAGGCITTVADDCMLQHKDGVVGNDSAEPYAKIVSHEDPGVAFISRTFLNKLQELQDPRIPLIMAVYPKGEEAKIGSTDWTTGTVENCAPEKQKGLPGCYSMGLTSNYSIALYHADEFTPQVLSPNMVQATGGHYDNGIAEVKDIAPATPNPTYYKRCYSQPNRFTYGDVTAPTLIVTAAQTNLLLAEAAQRGYISGSAQAFYEAGVRCAMQQFKHYPATEVSSLMSIYLDDAAVGQYLATNAYDPARALQQINEQYWITCFFDEYETYANWRRSGYPDLQPMGTDFTHPGGEYSTLGQYGPAIVRRFTYPTRELQINPDHYTEALQRMGKTSENDFDNSRVWWDR